jgi:Domain of unknown function (DUF932)
MTSKFAIDALTPEQAMAQSGQDQLTYTTTPLYLPNGNVSDFARSVLCYDNRYGRTHEVAMCGTKFVPPAPGMLYEHFAAYIDAVGGQYVNAGIATGYAKIWAQAKFSTVEIVPGDPIDCYATTIIGFDGSIGFSHGINMFAILCQNQIARIHRKMEIHLKNTKNLAARVLSKSEGTVLARAANKALADTAEEFRSWATRPIKPAHIEAFVKAMFPQTEAQLAGGRDVSDGLEAKRFQLRAAINESPGQDVREGLAWQLFNGVTHFETHTPVVRAGTNIQERALFAPQPEIARQRAIEWIVANV